MNTGRGLRALGALWLLACGGPVGGCATTATTATTATAAGKRVAFDPHFADNVPARTARALQRMGAAPSEATADAVLVGVRGAGAARQLVAIDATTGALRWQRAVAADTRPQVVAGRVWTTAGGALVAYALADGAPALRWPMPAPIWVGAAADPTGGPGAAIIVTRDSAAAPAPASVVTALGPDGRLRWAHRVPGALGQPLVRGGVVALPWRSQFLVFIDSGDGRELARVRAEDDVLGWARWEADRVLTGDRGVYALTPAYAGLRPEGGGLRLPIPPLTAAAAPFEARGQVPGIDARAAGGAGIRMWLQATTAGPALGDGRLYQLLYRHVFAVDADGVLRWATRLDADLVDARAVPGGLWIATQDGQTAILRATDGARLPQAATADGPAPWRSARLHGVPTAGLDLLPQLPPPAPLVQRLQDIAGDTDARLLAGQALAVRSLCALPDPALSASLVALYQKPQTAPGVRDAIATCLTSRTAGVEHLLAALEVHQDYLRAQPPPPLGLLVPALHAQHETRAVPAMLGHLFDPATPIDALPALATAIGQLGDAQARTQLLRFVRMYRADSALAARPEALVAAMRQLQAAGHDDDPLRRLAAAAWVHPALRAAASPEPATGVVAHETPQRTTGPALPAGGAAPSAPPTTRATTRPPQLSRASIDATFDAHLASLQHCAAQVRPGRPGQPGQPGRPVLTQARVALVIRADGSSYARAYAPADAAFAACADSVVEALRFERFAGPRQTATYVISLPTAAQQQPRATPNTDAQAAWWTRWVRPAGAVRSSADAQHPWWHDRNPLMLSAAAGRAAGHRTDAPVAAPTGDSAWKPYGRSGPERPRPAAPSAEPAAPDTDGWWKPYGQEATPTRPADAKQGGDANANTNANTNAKTDDAAEPDAWWTPVTPGADAEGATPPR